MGYFSPNVDPDPQHHDLPPGSTDLDLPTITREEWRAEMRRGKKRTKQPFKLIVEHFTYTDPCSTLEECSEIVYNLQKEDLDNGLTDIKYNFVIGGDGNIYEGRGWNAIPSKSLMQAPRLIRRRLDIAFIGDYTDQNLPEIMFERKMDLIDYGVKFGMIKSSCNTLKARREDDFPPENIKIEKNCEKEDE